MIADRMVRRCPTTTMASVQRVADNGAVETTT